MDASSKNQSSQRSGITETAFVIAEALLIAMVVRILFYQPFNIPSGSMKETLLVGDYLFVSKMSYGYSRYSLPFGLNLFSGRIFSAEPQRGDVAVFKLPRDNSTDYIKRVIGLPGDKILMKNGQLFINDSPVPKVRKGMFTTYEYGKKVDIPTFEETLPNGVKYTVTDAYPNSQYDDTVTYKVPPNHYFMMGDNRDNSTDSRANPINEQGVGYVPIENFVGRAEIIFFSCAADEPGSCKLTSPWTWPSDIRWNRIFKIIR